MYPITFAMTSDRIYTTLTQREIWDMRSTEEVFSTTLLEKCVECCSDTCREECSELTCCYTASLWAGMCGYELSGEWAGSAMSVGAIMLCKFAVDDHVERRQVIRREKYEEYVRNIERLSPSERIRHIKNCLRQRRKQH